MNKKILLTFVIILSTMFLTSMTFAQSLVIVSDGTTQWSADGNSWNNATATWVHPSWPTISGATWIWDSNQTDSQWEYANVPDGGWYFKTTFNVPNCTDMGTLTGILYVDADNSESSIINGHFLGQDGSLNKSGPDNYEWNTTEQYNLTGKLIKGENVLIFRALNFFDSGLYNENPAGLIFKADITYNDLSKMDSDHDGVNDCIDKCPGTTADVLLGILGTNRYKWNGTNWTTNLPKGKGNGFMPTMANTEGCSCTQIIKILKSETGDNYCGHLAFGCSRSIFKEEWYPRFA